MDTPTNYLIAASVCLVFAYLIYLLFFRKETNFRQRRFFLIFAAVFSLLLPTGSYYILLPLTTKTEIQIEILAPSPVLESPVPQVALPDFYPVPSVSLPDTEPVKKSRSIDWLQALQYLYIAGVIVLLLRFIVQLVTISSWYSRSRKVKQPLFTLLFHERFSTPFSFFNWIFLTEKRLPETDFEKIIAHESVHVKQRHSFDAVFFELLCIFMWFNPFVWMMRRSINLTHEFLADEGAIESGIDSLHYQALMVNQVAEANIVSVTSHFNKSLLSQRIKMIANSRLYKKAKYKILVLAPVALILFLFIAGVNGLDKRKVLYRNLKKDAVFSKVFSKDEIKDLVELRLMTDEMVVNTTGEPDTKIAYPKFNELLSGKRSVSEFKEMITLSHDSLVTVVKSHPVLLEIYDVSNSNNMSFSINRHGKVMELLQELSKQNAVYKEIIENIEIAGDISPSTIASFVNVRDKYNMESEAERLYASIIYGILTNRILKRGETGDIHRSSTYAHIDTELLLLRFRAYQKSPSDRNAELLYEALPEKGHIKLEDSERETIREIADNLGTLEKQVLSEQRNSVKVAFRMFTISDGAFTEWLQILLGNLITKNPEMFLEELKVHRHLCRELPIYNLGPEFVDRLDERIDEYRLRIAALETVSADELTEVKSDCIGLLEKRSTPFERYKLKKDSKLEPNISLVNKSDYSPDFIESIRNSSFRGSNILLDRNKFILENDSVTYYFPDYIPIGKNIILSGQYGQYRNLKIDLSFKRINQSSIDYAFQVYKGENKITENTGTAHLSPFFWLGLEMDFDLDLRKEFKYEEFKDDEVGVSIRIGQEDNGDLKAKILYGTPSEEFYIDRNNSPVLRAKNTTIKEKDGRQGVENASSTLRNAENQSNSNTECGCFNGIGSSEADKPSLVAEFSNGVSVSVCGYERERISDTEVEISEFNIFDCKTGESLLEYSAVHTCNVKLAEGKLYITELEDLPAGENWKWESIPMMQEYLFLNGDNLSKSPRKFVYQEINIPKTRVDRFLQEVRNLKGKGYNKDFETILGRLALLALNGNIEAKNILSNFETYFNSSPDGSVAELLNRWTSLIYREKDNQSQRNTVAEASVNETNLQKDYQLVVSDFIKVIKSNNVGKIADKVAYPLKREYPVPSIKNKQEFINRYKEVFDDNLKHEIINSNSATDWSAVGWRGIMLKQGIVWLDYNGRLIGINYQPKEEKPLKEQLIETDKETIYPSLAEFEKPICVFETSEYRIRIDDLGDGNYRYASWSINKSMKDKPDQVIENGEITFEGSGGNHTYKFENAGYRYECSVMLLRKENSTPAILKIFEGNQELKSQSAKIVEGRFSGEVMKYSSKLLSSEKYLGDLRYMDVQTLFDRLRFKPTLDFMPDPDEEKFIVYGETYGNDLISGIRLDVRNWLSYDDLKFLMDNLESQEPCKSMMSIFSSWMPDVESTIGGFAALFLDYYRKNQLFHPLVATPINNPDLVQELKEWWENYNNENTRK